MRTLGLLLLPILAITLLLGGTAFAQGDYSYYFVTYYSNANNAAAPDGVLRLINDGDKATSQTEGVPNGPLWASIYVFDDSEELQECCSCLVTPDGLLSESVNNYLTANPVTGKVNTRGVIKVISSTNDDATNNYLAPGLRGWMTHIQATTNLPQPKGPFFVTEAPLADSNLSSAEDAALESSCSFAITLGSGHGICTCSVEDHDF